MNRQKSIFNSFLDIFVLKAEQKEKKALEDEKSKKKVLVGGGTGFIGSELCKNLKRKGYLPVVVSRTAGDSKITYNDLKNLGIPNNTQAVVNLAGQNVLDIFHRWTPTFKTKVYDSRIETAKAFKQAIELSPPEKRPEVFVQITGIGYFPPKDNVLYNENTIVDPSDRDYFSNLVVDWESAATLPPDLGVRNVFIRPGVVLGRNGGMIQQIFPSFYLGGGGRMGSGTQPMPWIHVKDLSGLIIHSIENKSVNGVLNGVAPNIITNQEFVTAFANALNRPAFFAIPETVWNLLFGQERAAMITKGQKVEPKRTLDSGYEFQYPIISKACEEFSHFFYNDLDD